MKPELPNRITTKAQAIELAAHLFPGQSAALARLDPATTHPRYELDWRTSDTLRELFFWLHEERPTIYKRARWHLFYDIARRLVAQADENGSLKWSDIDARHRNELWQAKQAAQIITGDGQGI